MHRGAWILVLALVGCAAPGAPTQSQGAPTQVPGVADSIASTPPDAAAASPSEHPSQAPLDGLLPAELDGVELHTFAVGQDILARLAAELGVATSAIEARYASDHGARFVQMYALRVAGVSADEVGQAWRTAAYPPTVTDVALSSQAIGARQVIVVNSPVAGVSQGAFYLIPDADTLFVVQAFEPDVAAEALAALP